jgi:uncharacterized protein (UPF0276 family)
VKCRVAGVGLGLRWEFADDLLARITDAGRAAASGLPDFVEVAPENYVKRGGKAAARLASVAERLPVVTHGLTMSLGGHDALDAEYLRDVRAFVRAVGSPWHSDHMCFGSVDGRFLHELLPVAFKRENVTRISDRIRAARDALGVDLAVENVSYYLHPGRADVGEAEFLSAVCEAASCGLMLDVNNAFVNAMNFGFDVRRWCCAAPLDRVVAIHVAGHEWFDVNARGLGAARAPLPPDERHSGAMIVDTHGAAVSEDVLALLGEVLARTGPVPIVLERDQHVPPLDDLLAELARIRAVVEQNLGGSSLAGAEQDAALAEVGE